MSRVAKAPIVLPSNVDFTLTGDSIEIKGPKGTLTQSYNKLVSITRQDTESKVLVFKPATEHSDAWAHAGTARALIKNMVKGVTEGFSVALEMIGVGYRAQTTAKGLNLALGFSHPVEYSLPEGVSVETPNNTTIVLRGMNKQLLGEVAAQIRAFRPPEPYKGKGIRYVGERVNRKEAKKK